MHQALQIAENLRPQIVEFMSRLIKSKGFSGTEKNTIQVIREEMEKVGFDEVKIDALGSIIGRIGNGKTKIAMDAHIDTVNVGNTQLWHKDPFSGDWDTEWVYGRGASDQKAGMCSMVYGMKILKDLKLLDDFTVYVTGTVMEEDCDGLCWRHLVNEGYLKPDFVVITEPTSLRVYRGHRGRVEFKVRTVGRSAHASAPERGDNAVYKMMRIVQEIEKLNERIKNDPFLGKGTIVVSQISSVSPSCNAVPDECTIYLDRRLTKGETKETAYQEIREIFTKTGIAGEIQEVTYTQPAYTGKVYPTEQYFPTWVLEEQHPLIQTACENYKQVFESAPVVDKWTFSTNGCVTAGVFGIPTVGFGPGDEHFAHAPDEKVKIEHLVKAAAFYANFPKVLVQKMNK